MIPGATPASRGHAQLAYRAAAEKYAQAAGLVMPFDRNADWTYLLKQTRELYDRGLNSGENQALDGRPRHLVEFYYEKTRFP